MEFKANVEGEVYNFSSINSSSYLVSGEDHQYILYKTAQWQCADQIPYSLLKKLGEAIDSQGNRR
jgi:hypothetical protein